MSQKKKRKAVQIQYKSNRALKQKPDKNSIIIIKKTTYPLHILYLSVESRKYCQVEIKDLPNGLGNDKHPNIKMGQEYRKFRKNI